MTAGARASACKFRGPRYRMRRALLAAWARAPARAGKQMLAHHVTRHATHPEICGSLRDRPIRARFGRMTALAEGQRFDRERTLIGWIVLRSSVKRSAPLGGDLPVTTGARGVQGAGRCGVAPAWRRPRHF